MEVCRKCGAALRDTDKFCSQCGTRVPSAGARARQAKAQKGTHYRENFEEGENRSRALRATVTVLVLMLLAVAGFAAYYFLSGRSASRSEPSGNGNGSAPIEILSEGQAVSETAAPQSEEP